ncbi:MAG: hypothetical protein JSS95_03350 [Acidobacteria bacterium]|nr:hypothetical protein [Acidobacteriota bacterium]
MISPYDAAQTMEKPEERVVAPLEFHELRAIEEMVEAAQWVDSDQRWREQIASLEAKLVLEKGSARVLVEEARREAQVRTREEIFSEMEKRIDEERSRIAGVVREFGRERERYFVEVEDEVAGLALAIARRVIHREASLDPLLLRAAVRVALDKVAGESNVTLRVAEGRGQRWRDALATERGDVAVAIVEGSELQVEELVLETSVGRVDLGVNAQLKEIERGFFDLLKKRPTL